MSAKRKASFPIIACPDEATTDLSLDNTPKHLNSRTRKRLRNNRPSDEVVYGNTLRRLFSAQQNAPPAPSSDEDMAMLEPSPPPESSIDPRQHTLLEFFKPVCRSLILLPSDIDIGKPDSKNKRADSHEHDCTRPAEDSVKNMTNSSTPREAYTAMEIDTEMSSTSDESVQGLRRCAGKHGWV